MLIVYSGVADKLATDFLATKFPLATVEPINSVSQDPNHIVAKNILSNLNQDLVVIGGQDVNSMYAELLSLGVLGKVDQQNFSEQNYGKYKGFNVYGLAGWTREGTLYAVEQVFLNPNSLEQKDKVFATKQVLKELMVLDFPLKKDFDTVITKINPNQIKANIEKMLQDKIMDGWHIEGVSIDDKALTITVLIRADGSVEYFVMGALTTIAIGVSIASFGTLTPLTVAGLVAVNLAFDGAVIVSDWQKGKTWFTDVATDALESGDPNKVAFVTNTAKAWGVDLSKTASGETSFDDYVKWGVALGVIGLGGYFFVKSGLFEASKKQYRKAVSSTRSKLKSRGYIS